MSETRLRKKSLLTSNDVCLYCEENKTGIYYDTVNDRFFAYLEGASRDYVFVLTPIEAKNALKELKNKLSDKQIEICKGLWQDF